VQTIVPLAKFMDRNISTHAFDPGALKVTIPEVLPSERRLHAAQRSNGGHCGAVLEHEADVGEAKLKNPLPWDRVPPTDYIREDHVTAFLNQLRAAPPRAWPKTRTSPIFREDIAQFKKNLATQTVSLNEAERRQEKEEAKAREEVRKQERAARKESQPTTYEITLKNAETLRACPRPKPRRPAVAKLSESPADEPEEAGAGVPQSDPVLRESERILADYVSCCATPPHWPWQRIDG
jgi:hypothetical protein